MTQSPTEKRDYTGWCFLFLLVTLVVGVQMFTGNPSKTKQATDAVSTDVELKEAITKKAISVKGLSRLTAPMAETDLKTLSKKIAPDRFNDPSAAEVYGVIQYELRLPLTSRDLMGLKKDSKLGSEIYKVLWTDKFTPDEAAAIAPTIAGGSFVREMVRTELYAKANNPQPRQKLLARLRSSQTLEMRILAALAFGSFCAWVIFLSLKAQGQWKPLGLPNFPATVFQADRMASWTAGLFFVYSVLIVGVELVGLKFGRVGSIVGTLTTVILFIPLVTMGGDGGAARLGMSRIAPWGRYVGLGFIAFLMEFPITAIATQVGSRIFPDQTAAHPVMIELLRSHDVLMILAIGLQASVQAPLFEELIFRGYMLPAMAKVTGSLVVSVGVTSFIFASLHPQGVGAWLGLATIAAASCALAHHSKSLVPSIVMHGLHNAFTLAVFLITS